MDCKEFLKPSIPKIVALVLLVLIFGVPATVHICGSFPLTSLLPPCSDSFGLVSPAYLLINSSTTMLDVSITIQYNPLLVGAYLLALYLGLCLLFHFTNQNWKRAFLALVWIGGAVIVASLLLAVFGARIF